ncbi:MAG: hypothetical protein DMF61_12705 [Blastocatellia bacterium AA13]|nr:MAG: hypothetical protein DMF61_12705 [Blastocatellia bacterium AA13]
MIPMTSVCCRKDKPSRKKRSFRGSGRRWLKFNAVGVLGFAIQIGMLLFCVRLLRLNYLIATVVSVETAVVHNFLWHHQWTWSDRRPGFGTRGAAVRFIRFNAGSGLVSLVGNLVLMRTLAGAAHIDLILSSLISVVSCSIVNFLIADRLIFCRPRRT